MITTDTPLQFGSARGTRSIILFRGQAAKGKANDKAAIATLLAVGSLWVAGWLILFMCVCVCVCV